MGLSLYLHIPFCQVRCAYCDFNTYAGLQELMPAYARALAQEIHLTSFSPSPDGTARQETIVPGAERSGRGPGGEVHTIFFGGGTPSLLPLSLLSEIFAALRVSFELKPDCEITLEANPGTVSLAYLEGLRALGVNRLSFGVQSARSTELRLLDRQHSFEQVIEAVRFARAAGFDNLNLDLIFGIPHQTLAAWQQTLTQTLSLTPNHLSLYALSLEFGTPMRAWVYRGLLPMPDPDLAADMYEWACEVLVAPSFVHYEISNWARANPLNAASQTRPAALDSQSATRDLRSATSDPQSAMSDTCPGRRCRGMRSAISGLRFACRHNLQYWRNLPYLGFGAGAHGCAGGWRYSNVLSPRAYIRSVHPLVSESLLTVVFPSRPRSPKNCQLTARPR